MAPTKVLAEYAKSGRSTCKGCGKGIGSGVLRVGSSVKDPRGFDSTKWYHLDCFPVKSHPIGSVEDIVGVVSLKKSDKDAIGNLVAGASSSEDKKRDRDDANQSDGSSMKKLKVSASIKDGPQIEFSLSEIKDNYKDATLSSNWKAFQTLIFNVKGDGLHDSANIAAFDFDGCLANTNVRITGANAWKLMYSSIPEKLKELYNNGYKLVHHRSTEKSISIEGYKNRGSKRYVQDLRRFDLAFGFFLEVHGVLQIEVREGFPKLRPNPNNSPVSVNTKK